MQKILCVLKKEFKQIFRDKQMAAIIFLLPLIQLLVIGFAISGEVNHVKLAILDNDRTSLSRQVAEKFSLGDSFTITESHISLAEAQQQIREGKLQALLVIPPHFSQHIERQRPPQIGLFLDGLDGTVAGIAGGFAQQILQRSRANRRRPTSAAIGNADVV